MRTVGNIAVFAEWAIPIGPARRVLLEGGWSGVLWTCAALCTVLLLFVLYRYERRLVSRGMGVTLLALRIAAAIALGVALLDPTSELREDVVERSRIVLGVDLSESMDTIDPPESGGGLGKPESRRAVAASLLEGPWLKRLQEIAEVDAVGFARGARVDVSPSALAEALRQPSSDDTLRATDWQPALERAASGRDRAAAAVILLTDGRENHGDSAGRAARLQRLVTLGIPVHSVLIGSANPPPDAAIARLDLPDRILKGDTVDITATVKVDGEVPGGLVPVRLERDGKTIEQKFVRTRGDGKRPTVTFHTALEEVGYTTLSTVVGPVHADSRADNDRRSATIQVVDEKTRVLVIDGDPRWEFRYLHNLLTRDTQVELKAIVFRQEGGDASAASFEKELPPRLASAPDPLSDFDVVILGDVAAGDLSESDWARIVHYVDERGGTLIWSAGRRTLEVIAAHAHARQLLPITEAARVDASVSTPAPVRASLPEGVSIEPASALDISRWPMLRFADEDANAAVWAELPGQPQVIAGRAKPSSESIVSLPSEIGENRGVMAAMPYGLGRVFWSGVDATWRWRFRADDTYHRRFWGQLIRWARAEHLTAGDERLRFGTSRGRYLESEPIVIKARFAESVDNVGSDWLVAARVYRAKPIVGANEPAFETTGEPLIVLPLRASEVQQRLFEASCGALSPGLYAVRLQVPQLGASIGSTAIFEVAPTEGSERVELAATREPLNRLAASTGGTVVTAANAMELVKALKPSNWTRVRIETASLWDRPAAFVVLLGLLSAEWFLRKRAGLP